MATRYFEHPIFKEHVTPPGHPERVDRLRALEEALTSDAFAKLDRAEAPRADESAVLLAHPESFLSSIKAQIPEEGLARVDADTVAGPKSMEAALHGIGAAMAAVDGVFEGTFDNAFVAARPPGHHAEKETAMGFGLFNTAAIAARHAQAVHGAERVAIVDWDVHHGNGTQDIFWDDRSVMYASTHEMPLFPGTGAASERGNHDTIVNVPLRAGDDGPVFREAFEAGILRRLDAYAPDLIIISAGFDAHHLDPLGHVELTEADFGWATRRLMALADRHAGGRVVSVLEGGYSLKGLGLSVAAHVDALMGR